jgi:hypothetical protein
MKTIMKYRKLILAAAVGLIMNPGPLLRAGCGDFCTQERGRACFDCDNNWNGNGPGAKYMETWYPRCKPGGNPLDDCAPHGGAPYQRERDWYVWVNGAWALDRVDFVPEVDCADLVNACAGG